MSKFDPQALPFFETRRGGGPITDWQQARDRSAKLQRLTELEWDKTVAEGKVSDAKATASRDANIRRAHERAVVRIELEIEALKDELGIRVTRRRVVNGSQDSYRLIGDGEDGNGNRRLMPAKARS